MRIGRGNHEAFGAGLVALRGWYPIEILHFPVRSLEHCMRKYVTQFVALERNAEKGIPGHMAEAYRAYRAGSLPDFYAPLVVEGAVLERRIEQGELVVDTRLRDRLSQLGFGAGATADHVSGGIDADAAFAAEFSALQEADLGLALAARVNALERRLAVLERLA